MHTGYARVVNGGYAIQLARDGRHRPKRCTTIHARHRELLPHSDAGAR